MFVGELIFKYSERKQVHSNFVKLIFAQIFEFFVRDTIIKSLNELKNQLWGIYKKYIFQIWRESLSLENAVHLGVINF